MNDRHLFNEERSEIIIRRSARSYGAPGLWMAAAFCVAVGLAVMVLALRGVGERGTDDALLVTARFSFLLFWLAYSGSAMAALFGPTFRIVKEHARDFGLAFASAHLVHIGLVIWLCLIGAAPPLGVFVFFGIALFWIYLLAILSIDRLHRAMGRTWWWVLSTVGLNYIAYAFAVDFVRLPSGGVAGYLVFYLPFAILSIAGPVLRGIAGGLRSYQNWRDSSSPAH